VVGGDLHTLAFLLAAAQRLRLKSQPASGGWWRGDSAGRQGTRQDLPGLARRATETSPRAGSRHRATGWLPIALTALIALNTQQALRRPTEGRFEG